MECDITTAEAMMFAVAVHEAVNEAQPKLPTMIIMDVASKVDFATDTMAEDVQRLVHQAMEK